MFRTTRFKTLVAILLFGGGLLSVWALWIEPDRLTVKEYTLAIPDWPERPDRLKIAALSDLHIGSPHMKLDKLRRIVARVNEAKPDLVVLLGDFVIRGIAGGSFIEPELTAEELKGLQARYGAVAVLGNHDNWYDGPRVRRALEQCGIRVLENESLAIHHGNQDLWLAGLADVWTRRPNLEEALRQVPVKDPVIVLTHNPDVFPALPARVKLTFAGHTHGGQVSLPLIGRPIVPSQYGQRYAIGHIVENGRHLFVTPGLGSSIIPVRLRVPPEISIVTVRQTSDLRDQTNKRSEV